VNIRLITISDIAAEKIKEIQQEYNEENLFVRIRVVPG
jgi:Fe-S cluster assembly iron-binding protein IscA